MEEETSAVVVMIQLLMRLDYTVQLLQRIARFKPKERTKPNYSTSMVCVLFHLFLHTGKYFFRIGFRYGVSVWDRVSAVECKFGAKLLNIIFLPLEKGLRHQVVYIK